MNNMAETALPHPKARRFHWNRFTEKIASLIAGHMKPLINTFLALSSKQVFQIPLQFTTDIYCLTLREH